MTFLFILCIETLINRQEQKLIFYLFDNIHSRWGNPKFQYTTGHFSVFEHNRRCVSFYFRYPLYQELRKKFMNLNRPTTNVF